MGNEVATSVNEYKPAASYEVEFNVAQVSRPELACGEYFYSIAIYSDKLQCGSFVETKKMILLH
ncbi:MAG: hypothetical protein K6T54_06705 [Ignavibacterium sp.]|nr:hypothetical protein [Ignavibacterium sp.]